jgi:hypothetical protein
MSAAHALRAAQAAGIKVTLDDDGLLLEADAEPPQAIFDALVRYKPGVMALLRPSDDGWSAEDWQVYFDERAAIAEFDGGLLRADAEARAFACCVAEWLNRNPMSSPPRLCARCGDGDQPGDPLEPIGTETTGYTWLHSTCLAPWREVRRGEAIAALAAMGIST